MTEIDHEAWEFRGGIKDLMAHAFTSVLPSFISAFA